MTSIYRYVELLAQIQFIDLGVVMMRPNDEQTLTVVRPLEGRQELQSRKSTGFQAADLLVTLSSANTAGFRSELARVPAATSLSNKYEYQTYIISHKSISLCNQRWRRNRLAQPYVVQYVALVFGDDGYPYPEGFYFPGRLCVLCVGSMVVGHGCRAESCLLSRRLGLTRSFGRVELRAGGSAVLGDDPVELVEVWEFVSQTDQVYHVAVDVVQAVEDATDDGGVVVQSVKADNSQLAANVEYPGVKLESRLSGLLSCRVEVVL
eukprot:scaffold647973_cov46-Prasinocladus_malaysianus.AAC.1